VVLDIVDTVVLDIAVVPDIVAELGIVVVVLDTLPNRS
jgi:hypothetical protein